MGTAVNRTNVFTHPRLITFVEKERKTGALHSTTLKLDRLKIPGGGEEGSEGSGGGGIHMIVEEVKIEMREIDLLLRLLCKFYSFETTKFRTRTIVRRLHVRSFVRSIDREGEGAQQFESCLRSRGGEREIEREGEGGEGGGEEV